jgi:phage terminase large subunit
MAWGTTNPNGHDWVWQRFHPAAGLTPDEIAGRPLIIAPTGENIHLPTGYVQQLRSMPSEWVKRYVDASFDTAAGQIWDEWDRAVHVVPAIALPAEWPRIEALDHGRRNPTAYLQIAVDGDGNAWVEREYYQPGLVSQHAAAIRVLRGDRRWGAVVADPSVFAKNHEGKSVAGTYREHGIRMMPGTNDVAGGLLRVSEFLKREPTEEFPDLHPMADTLGSDGLGAPRLFVLDCCPNLIREIPQYVWRDLSPSQEEKADQPEEPRKKHDHACDALRYGLQSLPAPYRVADPNRQIEREHANPLRRAASAGLRDKSF